MPIHDRKRRERQNHHEYHIAQPMWQRLGGEFPKLTSPDLEPFRHHRLESRRDIPFLKTLVDFDITSEIAFTSCRELRSTSNSFCCWISRHP